MINAIYDSQQITKKFPSAGLLGDPDIVSVMAFACPNFDFYQISASSPLIYVLNANGKGEIKIRVNRPIISTLQQNQTGFWIVQPKDNKLTIGGKLHRFIPYEFLRRDFKRPEKGIVVNSEHLVGYLKDDLWKKLGLTDSEIADYWKDLNWRIPKSPYYFISLIDRSEIDRVLPMEINPKPDTIIRNMTYILPLSSPFIPIPLPEVKAPERKGFTVLENGGFIDGL